MNMIENAKKAVLKAMEVHGDSPPHIAAEAYAKAVLGAIREPTLRMGIAGMAEYAESENTPNVWRAMIDAALAEG